MPLLRRGHRLLAGSMKFLAFLFHRKDAIADEGEMQQSRVCSEFYKVFAEDRLLLCPSFPQGKNRMRSIGQKACHVKLRRAAF